MGATERMLSMWRAWLHLGKVQWERHARIEGLFDEDGNLQDITKLVSQFPSDFSPSSLGETS